MTVDAAVRPVTQPVDKRLEMYRNMFRARVFEKRCYDLFLQNLVKGTTHLYAGQEAIAAGVGAALEDDDQLFVTYRGHGHLIVRGSSMAGMLAEMLGRENGLMAGKGGSMHLIDASRGVLGSYAIIGAQLVIANGAAWSAQYRRSEQVTVCFFGDGATNIGAFHEALNFAAVWNLPIVFVCENNQYMEYTLTRDVTAVPRPAADRAGSYGLPAIQVDGNDVEAVHAVATAAVDKARAGGGPSLIEATTYRHGGHSRADPGKYRPDAEVKDWLTRDPITRYRELLIGQHVPVTDLESIEAAAKAEIDAATEFAKGGATPSPDLLYTNLWSDGGSEWRR